MSHPDTHLAVVVVVLVKRDRSCDCNWQVGPGRGAQDGWVVRY